jgi:hypothetical protein
MLALTILGLCIGAAFVCACVFLCMLWFSLPPDDAAYHAAPLAALTDPFFLSGAILVAVLVGLISFPFVYFTVSGLRLLTTVGFIVGVVLAEIVVITPFDRRLGLIGSLPALALGLCILSGSPGGGCFVYRRPPRHHRTCLGPPFLSRNTIYREENRLTGDWTGVVRFRAALVR